MIKTIDRMIDSVGNEIKPDDFVVLVKGKAPYIDGIMKKGSVFKIDSFRDVSFNDDIVAYLKSKTGNKKYSTGITESEMLKVDYDIKKRKITNYYIGELL